MIDRMSDIFATEFYDRLAASDSLHEFVKQAWSIVEGANTKLADGWYIQALCEHLEAVTRRQIKSLLVNVPFRTGKSTIFSVMWPAWVWINFPEERFLYGSYSHAVSGTDSMRCRRLIESPWYQSKWGDSYKLVGDQNTKHKFENDKRGIRDSVSVKASVTGKGASVLVLDDANNAGEVESDVQRERVNEWFDQVWSTRKNNQLTSVEVCIQQRLHESDNSGHILSSKDAVNWVKLILPMEFERARKCRTIILPSNNKVWEDPRTEEGELLCPQLFSKESLQRLKSRLGSEYRVSGQLQQNPSPSEGGIIKKSWFSKWKEKSPPKLITTIQSWDTAMETKDTSAYSACTTWGLFKDQKEKYNIILMSLWRGKVEYPELKAMAKRLYADYRDDGQIEVKPDGNHIPNMVLIESKVSGISLIQDLERSGILVTRFNPNKHGDKTARVRVASSYIEGGRVWLPARPPEFTTFRGFADLFVNECSKFPTGDSRDLVDTLTQVILRLTQSGWIQHPKDEEYDMKESTQINRPFYT